MLFGFDAPRLHAALNHFPAALLPVSVLLDLLGLWLKRDSLGVAGFWTLVAGVAGTGAAIVSGLLAANVVEHSEQAHVIMTTHEKLAFIVLAIFGTLVIWRIARRGVWAKLEQQFAVAVGLVGVAILIHGASLGGDLMFEHAVGVPTARLEQIGMERTGHEHHHDEDDVQAPTAPKPRVPGLPAAESARSHPGSPDTAKH